MESKEFIKFMYERTKEIYGNPDSILKRYDEFLALNNIYHSYDSMTFRKNIKGHFELCDGIIEFYKEAKLPNEKISFLGDLYAVGYDRDKMIQMIFEIFENQKDFQYLWECGDDIEEIMHQYSNHKTTWIRNTAKKYLKKHSIPLNPL